MMGESYVDFLERQVRHLGGQVERSREALRALWTDGPDAAWTKHRETLMNAGIQSSVERQGNDDA